MKPTVIIDTGFLVALLNRSEQYHSWVKNQLNNISSPIITCEPVITETCFLFRKIYGAETTILNLINSQKLKIPFRLIDEFSMVHQLMQRYQSVPMSLADACLVRMAEIDPNSLVLTLDSDFRIYRKNKNEIIPLVIPNER
ncbi:MULTISPECIES: type II toxin-antitoxin system VapC family toxin [Limnospira]|uniref:type II toxin-antitoxin system VapC family toxin n=1 Tax=Limnospira TaxID=2596745 RepID=UPI00028047B6|nr:MULTISPECIES: PIN domain-containing protein [unclassified Limnospira]EKD07768.1 PIN domain protein like protein [Arthrospira platensis C1]QJB25482.1 PIN domain-containing protein [Limnospira fusiformis SAG 85.79]MDT9188161.1 PIN domain-containing protein [Limnospira sp. PMC 894.15]MDT9234015.1 PIN domain-containing protein [Limnospira sp. PMC 917.15]UWU47280.1 putative nucleic acid-binding protein, contains PIN domain [Arthrospira platensis C1]